MRFFAFAILLLVAFASVSSNVCKVENGALIACDPPCPDGSHCVRDPLPNLCGGCACKKDNEKPRCTG
ncbi:hypothetical protein AAVH_33704 [Aphelenchoides avenae]|nr:hypothetical protein AAVH_33704 [Aphelenchus avenae]